MKLVCLGTAGYHPNDSRQTSCYLLPEVDLMLDAGSGVFRAQPLLTRPRLTILLSHAHLDHVVGLTYLLDLIAFTPLREVIVYGEKAKIDALREHLFSEALFPVNPPIQWRSLESQGDRFVLDDGPTVQWWQQEHPGGSVGFRCTFNGSNPHPKSIAYVTDTVARDRTTYEQHLKDVDLLLHECNFGDEHAEFAEQTGHSCVSKVAALAERVQARKLGMIHLNPSDETFVARNLPIAQRIFAKVTIPHDGDSIEF